MSKQHSCAWCGSEVNHREAESDHSWFCPDCHETYQAESHRSLHPVEERHPHND
ncbi:MAG: hypothetical protein ACOY94_01950 [Bacillota bacterium]